MKQALAVTLLSSMTWLSAWKAEAAANTSAKADAKPAAKGDTKGHAPSPAKGRSKVDPKPAAGSVDKARAEVKPRLERSYWLATDPHVPLAFVDGGTIHSVGRPGKTCGAARRWAKAKSRWNAVDAWGQITSVLEVGGSELYDVTRCREVFFKGKQGGEPHALLVSADSTWKPSPKVSWTPDDDEHKRFEHFTRVVEAAWVDGRLAGKLLALPERTLFFRIPASEEAGGKRPTHWAVVGGPMLLVAYLGEQGRWKLAKVEAPLGLANSYLPVGVFDMNGDGIPEIIYHGSDGPTFNDSVLSLDTGTMVWDDAAVSPGGSTL